MSGSDHNEDDGNAYKIHPHSPHDDVTHHIVQWRDNLFLKNKSRDSCPRFHLNTIFLTEGMGHGTTTCNNGIMDRSKSYMKMKNISENHQKFTASYLSRYHTKNSVKRKGCRIGPSTSSSSVCLLENAWPNFDQVWETWPRKGRTAAVQRVLWRKDDDAWMRLD